MYTDKIKFCLITENVRISTCIGVVRSPNINSNFTVPFMYCDTKLYEFNFTVKFKTYFLKFCSIWLFSNNYTKASYIIAHCHALCSMQLKFIYVPVTKKKKTENENRSSQWRRESLPMLWWIASKSDVSMIPSRLTSIMLKAWWRQHNNNINKNGIKIWFVTKAVEIKNVKI